MSALSHFFYDLTSLAHIYIYNLLGEGSLILVICFCTCNMMNLLFSIRIVVWGLIVVTCSVYIQFIFILYKKWRRGVQILVMFLCVLYTSSSFFRGLGWDSNFVHKCFHGYGQIDPEFVHDMNWAVA